MHILHKIVADKIREVNLKKSIISTVQLERSILFSRPTVSLSDKLRKANFGIIAEHKRRSPSKASINQSFTVEEVATGYENAGVSGISVLTDAKYFGGSLDDLLLARASVSIPLLRKEFIIDEYQILEAKAHGADVILLIAAILTRDEIKRLSEFAKSLNLEVLLEVHNLEELQKSIMPTLDMIGVNNRNLNSFEVSLSTSKQLSEQIPSEFLKISESGISSVNDVMSLLEYDFKGFLIGENFMKTDNAANAARNFIAELESSYKQYGKFK